MSRPVYPTQLRDHLGNTIRLPAKPFATGGEGALFDVVGCSDLVAKLYLKPQSRERCDKLRAMAKLCSPDLLKFAAWPTATLSNGSPAAVEGILMPRITDHQEIHHLYSVAQRKKDFPEADWGFLLHTARNCAIAFESVHGHGHVVGDVNQKNVMVSMKGIVALVDCDSFQVKDGNRVFRCGVGVPEYTPPELHGRKFTELDRDANHDLFGLAVLIFHLLMLGRHPFAGVPQVNTDIPIDKAIQGGLYAYARNPTKLKPPPHVLPMATLDAPMLDLFERAFRSPQRPTAIEWRGVLDASMKGLQRCKNDRKHSYPAAAGNCPWCQFIATDRLMFFIPSQGIMDATLRLEDIRRLISALAGMQLNFPFYTRPKPLLPIQVTLPAGLRAIPRPKLESSPPPPILLPRPKLRALPAAPAIPQAPKLQPHPPAPVEPPRPELHGMPERPMYPSVPTADPPDPFLKWFSIAGTLAGMLVFPIAAPVGVFMMVGFGCWWLIMTATEGMRLRMAQKALEKEHEAECVQMDEKYRDLVRPIDDANEKLMADWEADKALKAAEHSRDSRLVDEANRRTLAPWQAHKAKIEAEHLRVTQEVEQTNRRVLSAWVAENAARRAKHNQKCREIDACNQQRIDAWKVANSSWLSELQRWRDRESSARAKIKRLEDDLMNRRSVSASKFQQRGLTGVELLKSHHGTLQDYEQELRQAEKNSTQIQLDQYLDKSLIRVAKIKRITGTLILSLESFGIETAKDVELLNIHKVPGIGPVLSKRLFDWRDRLSRSFRPQKGLPESEKSRIANRYAPVLRPLAQSIQTAISDLEAIAASHRSHEAERVKKIVAAVQELAVAEAYVKAMNVV